MTQCAASHAETSQQSLLEQALLLAHQQEATAATTRELTGLAVQAQAAAACGTRTPPAAMC
jgi:hypothetical protein